MLSRSPSILSQRYYPLEQIRTPSVKRIKHVPDLDAKHRFGNFTTNYVLTLINHVNTWLLKKSFYTTKL